MAILQMNLTVVLQFWEDSYLSGKPVQQGLTDPSRWLWCSLTGSKFCILKLLLLQLQSQISFSLVTPVGEQHLSVLFFMYLLWERTFDKEQIHAGFIGLYLSCIAFFLP